MVEEKLKLGRRGFLKAAAAGAATLVGMRLVRMAGASETGGSSPHKWVMVIDQSKCIGCGHCTLACQATNDISPDIAWTRVIEAEDVNDKKVFLPRPCQHCEHAPCVEVCMVKASIR